jgi:hypothetical protein
MAALRGNISFRYLKQFFLVSPILEQFNGSSKCIWSITISSLKCFIDHDMIFVIADKAVIIIATCIIIFF